MGSREIKQIDMDAVLESMAPERLILTVNRRLSLEIRTQFNRIQLDKGHQAWESANSLAWSDWIHDMFQQLVDHGLSDRILLTSHQTQAVWEQIIRCDRRVSFLQPASVSRMSMDAWTLIHSWEIGQDKLSYASTSESERFLSWSKEFSTRCLRNNWIDQAIVPNIVAQSLAETCITLPSEIILAGFDEITPQQERLVDLLADMGCQVMQMQPAEKPASAHRFQAADITQELETAAGWAIQRLRINSDARVGIVIPQLVKLRSQVDTIFKRSLHPKAILQNVEESHKAYNISLGTPLSQCPLVMDAFLILNFADGEISCGDLSRLLRSPFIFGSSQENASRASLDAYIRKSVGERTISLDTLIRKTREFNACPILIDALEAFRRKLDHLPTKQSPQQWTDEFQALLSAVGWSRHEQMNSDEFQQLERLNETMTAFQMLGQVQASVTLHEAIGSLHNIAQETLFQPHGSDAPIQILGILETAGLELDHLWLMGMSDDAWPAAAAPNPLLPISIQRSLGLPHASPQRELEYAETITRRLLSSAGEVVVSHSETDGKNQLRVSPLVAHIDTKSGDELGVVAISDLSHIGFGSAELEEVVDNSAPQLPVGTHLSGGSRLLADQSACPFRAFANHRLGATVIEEPVSGVDARTKGIITHQILQKVWEQIEGHDRLTAMDDSELRQLVEQEVSKEISKIRSDRPKTFVPRFVDIEQQRVSGLILAWLEFERLREPFKVVSLEQKQSVDIGGLQLNVIADRIDELSDHSQLIIDYKTKKRQDLSCKGWLEPRIEEPQLPLYATTTAANITGVFLAGVNRASMGFKGVSEEAGVVPDIKAFPDDWDSLKAEWKQSLELLAQEILQGRAEVMPKDSNKDCTYCPLPALFRIHEWGEEL